MFFSSKLLNFEEEGSIAKNSNFFLFFNKFKNVGSLEPISRTFEFFLSLFENFR